MSILHNKTVLICGGTGSLGKVLTRRILSNELGQPKKVIIFSRDEAKQHFMRTEYMLQKAATDEIIYKNFESLLEFRIGDVRNYASVCSAMRNADIVINAAALKQVPTCEYFPYEAVLTNVAGAENIVRAIRENSLPVQAVVGVSTDKACKPINVMGMTKALQERIFIVANLGTPGTRFVCVRYGNVLASRGSVIPLFHDQIKSGSKLTITTKDMTRFLLNLEHAVDTIFGALNDGLPGEIYVPKVPSARIVDIATSLIGKRNVEIVYSGIRPGEKIHEILVTEEEGFRTYERGSFYVIQPMLSELIKRATRAKPIAMEYSSKDSLLSLKEVEALLKKNSLMIGQELKYDGEMLR